MKATNEKITRLPRTFLGKIGKFIKRYEGQSYGEVKMPNGIHYEVQIPSKFWKQLNPGDKVEIDYFELRNAFIKPFKTQKSSARVMSISRQNPIKVQMG